MFPGNPQIEDWVAKNIATQNEAAQKKAAADLEMYNQQVKEWQAATIQSRNNNAPIPQPPTAPKITQFYDAGGWIASRVVTNPAALPPTLPPMPTVGAPDVGIAGPAGTTGAARDAEMFRLLYENNAILKAIKAKEGV